MRIRKLGWVHCYSVYGETGQTFTILKAFNGSITGTFVQVDAPFAAEVVYGQNEVILMAGEETERVLPSAFTFFGTLVGGSLADLLLSDDQRVVIQNKPAFAPTLPAVSITVEGRATGDTATEILFHYEGHSDAVPAVPREIALFNYRTNRLDTLDTGTSSTTDAVREVLVTTNASDYVETGTGDLRARVGLIDHGTVFFPSWGQRVDHVRWEILP